jgi:hypothetical protein
MKQVEKDSMGNDHNLKITIFQIVAMFSKP